MGIDVKELFEGLVEHITRLCPATVAYSGGVDSSVVALAAYHACPREALAVTISSELCPRTETAEAEWVARSIGISHEVVPVDLLGHKELASNPPDRCYRCKDIVMGEVSAISASRGNKTVLDGTTLEDSQSDRPGLAALREHEVISPLADLAIDKKTVRDIARAYSLPNHDRPSSPCLATRFPYGTQLSAENLDRVHDAEEYLRSLGFTGFRVRVHDGVARLELRRNDLKRLFTKGLDKKIVAKLTSLGYNYVSLDLAGFRSGSMDEPLKRI